MNILIVGGGGREHALAWKAAQSPLAKKIFVAPGNAGTALEENIENVDIAADDVKALRDFALQNGIGLTIVGPEQPLVAGIVDIFTAAGLKCFGPTKRVARLEGSKAFAKDFLARHEIPTAAYGTFSDVDEALEYLYKMGAPIVIKADGLAAGKGVILAHDMKTAEDTVRDMLSGNSFGEAGHKVVIEEFLNGEEASFIVMADGKHILPMASSQDHKAANEGDTGPNTGGMGAYSPAPVVDEDMHKKIMAQIIEPTIAGMRADGTPYTGFLYAGVMIDSAGNPRVLEFNCRFGDPETQPIMMRLQSDLVAHCLAALEGKLDEEEARWDKRAAVGVVLAAGGYPDAYETGDVIEGLPTEEDADTKVFHAGTAEKDGHIVTAGGRVLCVTALGNSVTEAQHKAYALVDRISWKNMQYRKDIAYRAIAREQKD
jgi:phosphoribosylamine--glycine ligase